MIYHKNNLKWQSEKGNIQMLWAFLVSVIVLILLLTLFPVSPTELKNEEDTSPDISSKNPEDTATTSDNIDDNMMSIAVYIQDKEKAKTQDCGITKRVIYRIPQTKGVADASLRILFKDELSRYGEYDSIVLANGVARVHLVSSQTSDGRQISSLSSCESSHLVSVIRDTLTQYPSIQKVEIYTPHGKLEF